MFHELASMCMQVRNHLQPQTNECTYHAMYVCMDAKD